MESSYQHWFNTRVRDKAMEDKHAIRMKNKESTKKDTRWDGWND